MLSMLFFVYLKKGPVCDPPSVFLTRDGDFAELVPAHQREKPYFFSRSEDEVDTKGAGGRKIC